MEISIAMFTYKQMCSSNNAQFLQPLALCQLEQMLELQQEQLDVTIGETCCYDSPNKRG